MSPLTVFFRTLIKSSALFLGVGVVFLNPSLDWSARSAGGHAGVTAQKSPTEAAVDGLIAALSDSDAGVRRQAAYALGELRSGRAVEGLTRALKDEAVEVRASAISALGEIRDPRAAAAIAGALKDADPGVRARAASALSELRDKASVDALIGATRYSVPA